MNEVRPKSEFIVPRDGAIYFHTVKDRCLDLIKFGIWEGISATDLRSWFNNFDGELELYFAACLLDNFVFRSKKQTLSLEKELFIKHIPKVLKKFGYDFDDARGFLNFLKGYQDKVRLVEVVHSEDGPAKSSPILLRHLRREFEVNNSAIIKPEQIKREKDAGITCFIFIDDILATGDQFQTLYTSYQLSNLLNDCIVIYAPTVSHEAGVKKLSSILPNVNLTSSEKLDASSDVFKHSFDDNENDEAKARIFYTHLLTKYNFRPSENNIYGYGNLALAYAFNDSIPDNCLHLFWVKKDNWHPLIKR